MTVDRALFTYEYCRLRAVRYAGRAYPGPTSTKRGQNILVLVVDQILYRIIRAVSYSSMSGTGLDAILGWGFFFFFVLLLHVAVGGESKAR